MGATSVTGVGPGSALGLNKGNENMSIGVSRLIGPHLVAAGSLTVGASNNVALPLSSGVYSVSVNVTASGSAVNGNGQLQFMSGNCNLWMNPAVSGLPVTYMVAATGNA
jgi:hypothetical protein